MLDAAEVEALLVDMILDQKLRAHIDQVQGYVLLQPAHSTAEAVSMADSGAHGGLGSSDELFAALSGWADKLALVNENLGAKIM